MNARVESWGIVVTFTERPPDFVLCGLRSHGFRFNREAGFWFRASTKHAGTVIDAMRRLATMARLEPQSPQDAPEGENGAILAPCGQDRPAWRPEEGPGAVNS